MTMSQAPAGKKGGKGPPKKNTDDDKNALAKSTDDKDEVSSNNGDKKEIKETNGADIPKPPSAGVNIRDVAAKILVLAQKGEWSAVEQTLKVLEKLVAAGGEDTVSVPMAGIMDPVNIFSVNSPSYKSITCSLIFSNPNMLLHFCM